MEKERLAREMTDGGSRINGPIRFTNHKASRFSTTWVPDVDMTMNDTTSNADSLTSVSALHRFGTVVAVIAPFLGLLIAAYGSWGWGFSWVDFALLVVMYTATGLGITIGYHRLFTHRSFETIRPVKVILAVLGSMASQGTLLRWVATHRRHHQHSDQAEDPHSPHRFGKGFISLLRGWWYAQVGWIFKEDVPGLDRFITDLKRDRLLTRVSKLFGLWVVLGLLIPAIVGGLITGTWIGALLGFLWGGLVRVFLVHHVTWSINSVCHIWGTRPFNTHDESRNNFVFGLLAFGEGWHNNHHAFPKSARHGLRWWQLDTSYFIIRVMRWSRLSWNISVPSRDSTVNIQNRVGVRYKLT